MKVWIDQDLCTGDGLCEEIAPDVFVLLDDGLAYVKEPDKIFAESEGNRLSRSIWSLNLPRSAPANASTSNRRSFFDSQHPGDNFNLLHPHTVKSECEPVRYCSRSLLPSASRLRDTVRNPVWPTMR